MIRRTILSGVLLFIFAGCLPVDSPESSGVGTPLPATAPAPTNTPLPATDTPVAPTATLVPPTATQLPTTTAPSPTATATPVAAPDYEALWGRWANFLFTLVLRPDGTYEVVWPSEVGEPSVESGRYRYEGGNLRFMPDAYEEATPNPFMDGCRDAQPYEYAPMLLDDPRFMRLTRVSDDCHSRARNWDVAGATEDEVWQLLEALSDG